MLFKAYVIILLGACMCLSGCEGGDINSAFHKTNELIPITNWQTIGPFQFDTVNQDPKNAFYNKDLIAFNIDENSFSMEDTLKLNHTTFTARRIKRNNARIKFVEYAGKKITDKSNFYAFTNLYSPEDTEVALIIDGSYSYKIWLNQSPLVEVRGKLNTQKIGDRILPVRLKKGDNLLFAKVNRGGNLKSWDLIVGVSSLNNARDIYKKNYLHDFIQDPLVEDSFEVYVGPYNKSRIIVYSATGNIVADTVFENIDLIDKNFKVAGMHRFTEGFYNCDLVIDNDTLNEVLYKGDFDNLAENLSNSYKPDWLREEQNEDVVAALMRTIHLKNYVIKDSTPSEFKFYNRNRVFWSYSASEMVEAIKVRGTNTDLPGTFLKTYRSGINDSISHFLFHVCEPVVRKGRIPLIVIAPYELQKETMIEDWYISGLDQIEMDCKLADDRGFALLWLYMNGKNYDVFSAREDINMALERIKRDYDIDTTKVFLMGNCMGGKRALLLAANNPDRYAGIAVYEPITSGEEVKGPINYVSNFYNMPVFISHGKNDDQSPIENSRNFINKASELGFHPDYEETEGGHLEFSKDSRTRAFDFFTDLKGERPIVPTVIKFCTYDLLNCSSYWIRIDKMNQGTKATINAIWKINNKRIEIECANVNSFSLLLRRMNISPENEINVYVNKKLIYSGRIDKDILSFDL